MGGVEANALATFSTGGWCDGVVFYYGKNGRERKERNLAADRLPTADKTMRPIIRRFRHSLPLALMCFSLAMAKGV